MSKPQYLHDLTVIQTLGDPRRLEILRRLMIDAATLSQLGEVMDLHPAKVRYHLKKLEAAHLVTYVSSRQVRGFVEKYYTATAQAYFINQIVLPQFDREGTLFFLGSHDPALELLANHLVEDEADTRLVVLPVGSLEGLIALRQGFCQITGCHLYDPVDQEYNTSFVRHFFPGESMRLVTLAHRLQGLLVAPGNPKNIQSLTDLSRDDLMLINRKSGSGTRLWLDQQLNAIKMASDQVHGYEKEVSTHSQVAEAILDGQADVGLAVFAAARRYRLDFIPLFEERFDLVIPVETFHSGRFSPIMDRLNSKDFRNDLLNLGGYDPHDTGIETTIH